MRAIFTQTTTVLNSNYIFPKIHIKSFIVTANIVAKMSEKYLSVFFLVVLSILIQYLTKSI